MSKTPPPSFGRAGRPRRIGFSDLFLWDTAIELELTGFSMTELMGEINPKMLALYQDVRRKKKVSLERTREILPAALEEIGLPWAGEYRKALNGEESIVIDFGSWKGYIYSCAKKDGQWPPTITPIGQHFIDIEEALKAPTLAWQQDDMPRCADLLESAPELAPYLWPGAVERLRNAVSVEQVSLGRAMVMLELLIRPDYV